MRRRLPILVEGACFENMAVGVVMNRSVLGVEFGNVMVVVDAKVV